MVSNFKVGTAALIGRPNVGKSTLLNALVGQKVSIVSSKPQTTRSLITAFYEDERGQIFFTDTPGYYQGKAVSSYNRVILQSLKTADVVVYVVDQTRDWGEEDERIHHMIESIEKPVILVINKSDVIGKNYAKSYEILVGKQAVVTLTVSAIKAIHLKSILSAIYNLLPVGNRNTSVDNFISPLLSHTSREFLAEIIREKIYDSCGSEVPYRVHTQVTDVLENEAKNTLTIKGLIIVENEHYKPMLIGANGQKVSSISRAVQKELWVATNKETTVKLTVITREEYQDLN